MERTWVPVLARVTVAALDFALHAGADDRSTGSADAPEPALTAAPGLQDVQNSTAPTSAPWGTRMAPPGASAWSLEDSCRFAALR